MDVDGDEWVAPSDALEIINYLNAFGSTSAGEGEGESVDSAISESDFGSESLLDDDLLSLIAADSVTSKRKFR